MARIMSLTMIVLLAGSAAIGAADWHQWRGPERNGIVAESPPLIESFPDGGPSLVWKSEKIPGHDEGGYGSVSVAEGRAYVYSNWKYRTPMKTRTITRQVLDRLGWADGMPKDLLEKAERARTSPERANLRGRELQKFIRQWMKQNISREQRRYGRACQRRIGAGDKAVPWEAVVKLSTVRDRQFADDKALDQWFLENEFDPEWRKTVRRYVATFTPGAYDRVFCLDAATGRTIWKADLSGRYYGHSCSSTPCIVAGRCYVQGSNGLVYCFDAETGKEIWKVKSKANPSRTVSSSFVIHEGVAVLLAGPLTGLDPATGKILWTQSKVAGDYASAAYWRHGGRTYLVCNGARNTACFDAKTGEIVWTVPGGGWSTAAIAGDDMVLFTNNRKLGIIAYKLSPEKPVKVWNIPFTDRGASPVIHEGHVYIIGGRGNAHARCIELATGKEMWDEKLPNTEIASPVVVDGKILIVVGSSLYMIKADAQKYTLLGRFNPRIVTCTSPALVDGKVFLRLKDGVACYDLRR